MLTNQFKTTLVLGTAVVIAGALFTNQAIQGKKIQVLQEEQMNSVKSERVVVTATPTATPSATIAPKVFYGPVRPTVAK